jgi:hypothetical protein
MTIWSCAQQQISVNCLWWNLPLLCPWCWSEARLSSEVLCMLLCPLLDFELVLARLVWLRCMSIKTCAQHRPALCSFSCCYCNLPMKQKLRLFLWMYLFGFAQLLPMMYWAKHPFASLREKLPRPNHACSCLFIKQLLVFSAEYQPMMENFDVEVLWLIC